MSLFEITTANNQYHFPEHFRCNLKFYESKNFFALIPLSITFLNPKILAFLFSAKNSLT